MGKRYFDFNSRGTDKHDAEIAFTDQHIAVVRMLGLGAVGRSRTRQYQPGKHCGTAEHYAGSDDPDPWDNSDAAHDHRHTGCYHQHTRRYHQYTQRHNQHAACDNADAKHFSDSTGIADSKPEFADYDRNITEFADYDRNITEFADYDRNVPEFAAHGGNITQFADYVANHTEHGAELDYTSP